QGQTRPGLNKSLLVRIPFPVPPVEEQRQILEIVDSALSEILQGKRSLKERIERSKALRQSILKSAFTGQLVPQDPNDEPASVLLERIAAQRAATNKTSAPKRTRP